MNSEVLSCKKTDKLLGVHIINAIAGDIISGACIGIEYGAASEEPFLPCEMSFVGGLAGSQKMKSSRGTLFDHLNSFVLYRSLQDLARVCMAHPTVSEVGLHNLSPLLPLLVIFVVISGPWADAKGEFEE